MAPHHFAVGRATVSPPSDGGLLVENHRGVCLSMAHLPLRSNLVIGASSEVASLIIILFDIYIEETETEMAANNRRSFKELNAPNSDQQPLCITFTDTEDNFELKSGLINLLPSFQGLTGEDPHKHLKEFHVVCAGMKPHGITDEQLYLRAFPFSLKDKAKD
ncbi:UNVERIFIED_CONTAM: hypothetical protein Slati_2645500 [Sesamum latifolium]|uniref:Reverse transcriptase domain-containing protein n=1 Tax=Sesamum latifolium TaxID=2727402 RepID=A0AAW2VYQ0_9LAMI